MTNQKVRKGFEQVSNTLSRRNFVRKAIQGAFATLVALAASQPGVKEVLAAPSCCSDQAHQCSNCPSIYGGAPYCPSGYSTCTTSSGCSYCWYSSGSWVCYIDNATVRCTDCWNGSCGSACTCHKILTCCAPEP